MRHAVVTRVALALCGLLLIASLVFAWRVAPAAAPGPPPAPDATDGERPFALHCAACHEAADLAAELDPDPAASAELNRFLEDHGTATAAEDAAIVEYLRRLAAARRR